LSIASNIINIVVLIIQRYSFITTLFLGPSDDVITKFYCILTKKNLATGYELDCRGIGVLLPVGARFFLRSTSSRPILGPT
jgi:hypothetical protein